VGTMITVLVRLLLPYIFLVDYPLMKTSKRYSCSDVAFIGRK
jgi:hypothetical protein